MDRFRIEFEGFAASEAPHIKAQGWFPFKLLAMPDVDHPSYRYIFGVRYADVDLQYDALLAELGGSLDRALVRWAVARVEDRLRLGRIPPPPARTGPTEALVLTETDIALLRSLALEKTCEYQVRSGRELFCSAASPGDETAAGRAGLKTLAPTSRPMCKQCNLPDTDYICSYLTHPQVTGPRTIGDQSRYLTGALCEIGRTEIRNDPSRCRANGHTCWARIVSESSESAPVVPYLPSRLLKNGVG
jgi:hypothetical protein